MRPLKPLQINLPSWECRPHAGGRAVILYYLLLACQYRNLETDFANTFLATLVPKNLLCFGCNSHRTTCSFSPIAVYHSWSCQKCWNMGWCNPLARCASSNIEQVLWDSKIDTCNFKGLQFCLLPTMLVYWTRQATFLSHPRPCTCITCNTKFMQNAWLIFSCDTCHRHFFTSHPAYTL